VCVISARKPPKISLSPLVPACKINFLARRRIYKQAARSWSGCAAAPERENERNVYIHNGKLKSDKSSSVQRQPNTLCTIYLLRRVSLLARRISNTKVCPLIIKLVRELLYSIWNSCELAKGVKYPCLAVCKGKQTFCLFRGRRQSSIFH